MMMRKMAAEFLGTAILVFFAVGVATLMFGFKFAGASVAAGVVATALAFGLTLLALVYMIGPISGSHVNPAVTVGALLTGRIPLAEAVGYWIAQFAGGIVGALVLWGTFSTSPFYHRTITGLGADGYGKQSDIHIGVGGAFIFEIILTALFVFIVLRVTSATANAATAAIAIGLTLTVVHLVGIPVTGTSVNPARSLGPALVVGGTALSQVWLFIVAPLIGGVLAAGLHRLLYREESISAGRRSPAARRHRGRRAARTARLGRRVLPVDAVPAEQLAEPGVAAIFHPARGMDRPLQVMLLRRAGPYLGTRGQEATLAAAGAEERTMAARACRARGGSPWSLSVSVAAVGGGPVHRYAALGAVRGGFQPAQAAPWQRCVVATVAGEAFEDQRLCYRLLQGRQ